MDALTAEFLVLCQQMTPDELEHMRRQLVRLSLKVRPTNDAPTTDGAPVRPALRVVKSK